LNAAIQTKDVLTMVEMEGMEHKRFEANGATIGVLCSFSADSIVVVVFLE
jgi:hypothetical protein